MTRITNISDIDNMPFTPEARLPQPHLLAKWSELGLYSVDAGAGRFRLTSKGRAVANGAPLIKSGRHAGRIDLNAVRASA
jgi:hypothetical protein